MNELEVDEAQAPKRTAKQRRAQATQDQDSDEPKLKQQREATEALRKRFLEAGKSFYYRTAPGEPKKVAFTDHGKRLSTEHDDPSVIQGMVLRAQEKGWTTVRINGTTEFKAEAWVHATLAGLDVEGYTPRAIDLARWQDRRDQRSMNRTAPKHRGERVVVGTVLDHGLGHYEHDVQKQNSYVVKVATAQGEREIWGVDLARACEQQGVKRGDAVALVQQEQERVTVAVPLRDESGASLGTASQSAHRNRWEIIKLDSLGVREQHALKEAAHVNRQEPVVPRFDHAAARTERTPEVTRTPAYERTRGGR